MTFNEILKDELQDFFAKNGLTLVEEFPGYLRLESDILKMAFSYNNREHVCCFWLAQQGEILLEIDDKLLNILLGIKINLASSDARKFASSLNVLFNEVDFFNDAILNKIGDYKHLQNIEYTNSILREQNFAVANEAWNNKDYGRFLSILKDIEPNYLPPSYLKKQDIASRKIKTK